MKDICYVLYCIIVGFYAMWGAFVVGTTYGYWIVISSLLLCVLLSWLSYVGNPLKKGAENVREKAKG